MDISETLAPRSDQQNFDDYVAGPRTVTVTAGIVTKGSEQPVSIELAEYPGRPYRPNKSMRRVIGKLWGTETDAWTGRRLTLFGNPDVKYGGKSVGGIEIGAMSDIGDKPQTMPLTETRGKKRTFTVQPLKDAPKETEPWIAQWQAIKNALVAAGYEGDSKALLTFAGQVVGVEWEHPNKISAEEAQRILSALREEPETTEATA